MKRIHKPNPAVVSAVFRFLDSQAKDHGVPLIRYCATKWSSTQAGRASALRKINDLKREIADLEKTATGLQQR